MEGCGVRLTQLFVVLATVVAAPHLSLNFSIGLFSAYAVAAFLFYGKD